MKMSEGFLSQEEIDALLRGETTITPAQPNVSLSDIQKDALGEVGNICMGSAATTLSVLLSRRVSITTPRVSITNINEVSNMGMFTNALKSFQDLKSELKDIKSLLNEESQGKDKGNSAQSGKNPYKNETFSLSQTLLNIEKLLTEINSTNKKQEFNNGNYNKNNNGRNSSKNNDNSSDNPLRKNANDELRKYYSNQEKTYKDKKLELDKISKMTTKQFEDGFSKIVKGISKDVVDILDRDLLKKMVEKSATEMLKSSKYINKENLDEKYKEISQFIKNAGFNPNIFKSSSMFRKGYNEKLYETENNRKIQDLKRLEIYLKSKGINRNSNTDTMTGRQLEKLLEDNKRILEDG